MEAKIQQTEDALVAAAQESVQAELLRDQLRSMRERLAEFEKRATLLIEQQTFLIEQQTIMLRGQVSGEPCLHTILPQLEQTAVCGMKVSNKVFPSISGAHMFEKHEQFAGM